MALPTTGAHAILARAFRRSLLAEPPVDRFWRHYHAGRAQHGRAARGPMDPDAWHELVAAHTALQGHQEQVVVLLRRALLLVDLAVDASPDLRDFGTALHTDAVTVLADVDGELAHLEHAIDALKPDDGA